MEVKNIVKSFNNVCFLDHISIRFPSTGMVWISGKSGCGKTTLLNIIAKVIPADSGEVIGNEHVIYLKDNDSFFDELSVGENIVFNNRISKRQKRIIDYLGLTPLLNRKINELSGGQRQRVSIARLLCRDADIILCDEPTEMLDKENKQLVMDLLHYLARHRLVIIVSHDLNAIPSDNVIHYQLNDGYLNEVSNSLINDDKSSLIKQRINLDYIFTKVQYSFRILAIGIVVVESVLLLLFGLTYHYLLDDKHTLNTMDPNVVYYFKPYNQSINYKPATRLFNTSTLSINDEYLTTLLMPISSEYDRYTLVANQNCRKDYSITEGDILSIGYRLVDESYSIDLPVDLIVEEKDLTGCYLYANQSVLIDLVSKQHVEIVDEDTEELMTINGWEYMDRNPQGNWYAMAIDYDDIAQAVSYFDANDIQWLSPLYQQRLDFSQNVQIYRIFYWIVLAVLSIVVLVLESIFLKKEYQKTTYIYSLMHSFGINASMIKQTHLKSYRFVFLAIALLTIVSSIALLNLRLSYSYLLCGLLIFNNLCLILSWLRKNHRITL